MDETKCINFRECGSMIYENESEYNRFQKMKDEIAGFILPKRCKSCRVKAKSFFNERREKERTESSPDFVIGHKSIDESIDDTLEKYPHSRGGDYKRGNDYGIR